MTSVPGSSVPLSWDVDTPFYRNLRNFHSAHTTQLTSWVPEDRQKKEDVWVQWWVDPTQTTVLQSGKSVAFLYCQFTEAGKIAWKEMTSFFWMQETWDLVEDLKAPSAKLLESLALYWWGMHSRYHPTEAQNSTALNTPAWAQKGKWHDHHRALRHDTANRYDSFSSVPPVATDVDIARFHLARYVKTDVMQMSKIGAGWEDLRMTVAWRESLGERSHDWS